MVPSGLHNFVHLAALIGLLLVPMALAHPSTATIRRAADWNGITPRDVQPNCHKFDPDHFSTWDNQAYMWTKKVGEDIDCTISATHCPTNSSDIPYDLEVTWKIEWRTIATGVGIDIQDFDASKILGAGYTDELTAYPGHSSVGFSVHKGQQGYIAVTPGAVQVPGWFTDCGNGWEYGGTALAPETHVVYHLVIHN